MRPLAQMFENDVPFQPLHRVDYTVAPPTHLVHRQANLIEAAQRVGHASARNSKTA